MWLTFPSICKGIYGQRNKVEAVFSALKKRYGDQLYSKKWFMQRREMAMRFIAYNIRIIVAIQIAREKKIPLWVRA
ncbi:transposase [Candidatus Woesearchaeota archaeon]|nr:transposase [Candidatus Woesearchaeota archaeon]